LIFLTAPSYPCDLSELERIEELISSVDTYKKKISDLNNDIDIFYRELKERDPKPYISEYDIRSLIFKSFFIEIENKRFQANDEFKAYAEIVHEGVILTRNIPCEICGENRAIDRCHILPNRLGGLLQKDNIVFLCPTHHRLFDRFMLSKAEWGVINWLEKSAASKLYVETVTLKKQEEFWERLYGGNYKKITELSACDMEGFHREIVFYIRELFYKNVFSSEREIYKLIDKNFIHVCKKTIKALCDLNIIVKIDTPQGRKLAFTLDKKDINEEVVLNIWQQMGREY